MATILIAWEFGAGFGHLRRLKPFADALKARGHRVIWAARHSDRVRQFLADEDKGLFRRKVPWQVIDAPEIRSGQPPGKEPTYCYSQVLCRYGYDSADHLRPAVDRWLEIFAAIKPDLALVDVGPTVILSAHLAGIPVTDIACGWSLPGDTNPMGQLMEPAFLNRVDGRFLKRLRRFDRTLLENLNGILKLHDRALLNKPVDLYRLVNHRFMHTVKEMDHFAPRDPRPFKGEYVGIAPSRGHTIRRKRAVHVLMYLMNFAGVEALLESFARLPWQFTIHMSSPRIPPDIIHRVKRKDMTFRTGAVDFATAGRNCDAFVSNGMHGTCLLALLQGLPVLAIPMDSEKLLVSMRVRDLGAGLYASHKRADKAMERLQAIMEDSRFRDNARAFAGRYGTMDYATAFDQCMDKIEALLPPGK